MTRSDTESRRAWQRWGIVPATILVLTALALTGVALRPSPSAADPALDSEEAAFLDIINEYREDNNRQPLSLHPQLTAASDWHANDMALCNYLSHTDSLGHSPGTRVDYFGYPGGIGENAARGGIFPTAQSVFNAWKGSPGHNGNMLGAGYSVIGIGRAVKNGVWYWTTDFGNASPPYGSVPGDTGPAPGVGCQVATSTPGPTLTNAPTSTNAPTPTPTEAPTPVPTATSVPTRTPSPTTPQTTTPQPTGESIVGDTDCDKSVESEDALALLREEAGLPIDADCIGDGDVNCDDSRDAADALAIMRWVISLPVTLPADCTPIGA